MLWLVILLLGITSCLPANSIQEWTFSVFYAITKPSQSNLDIILSRFISRPNLHIIAPAGFWPRGKTRGGTLGVPRCIHTRTKNICWKSKKCVCNGWNILDLTKLGELLNTKISYSVYNCWEFNVWSLLLIFKCCKMLLEDGEARRRGNKRELVEARPSNACALAKILPETTVRA